MLYSEAVVTIAAAAVTAVGAIVAVWVGALAQKIRGELEACRRDRRQLRQVLQIVVSSLVGLLPEETRLRLLTNLDDALTPDDAD